MKKTLIVISSICSLLLADVHISGDARVRPRYDIKENSNGSSTSDLYYLYRGRVNLKADIGEGWFLSTKLAVNSASGMEKMGTGLGPGITTSYRPAASFSEVYFGYAGELYGLWSGIFPLKSGPSLDLHFYSDKLVDLPFAVFSNSSTSGFAGYINIPKLVLSEFDNKVNWFLSVDQNLTESEESLGEGTENILESCSNTNFSNEDSCEDAGHDWTPSYLKAGKIVSGDYYTLGINAPLDVGLVSVNPQMLITNGGPGGEALPTTFGLDFKVSMLAGLSSGFSYFLSSANLKDEDPYEASHMRVSFGGPLLKGKLKMFYDMASKDSDNVTFLWLSYSYPLFKSESGSVTVSPTYRLQNGKDAGTDSFDEKYSRQKFEVTVQMKFK